jgi:hypothetical protein
LGECLAPPIAWHPDAFAWDAGGQTRKDGDGAGELFPVVRQIAKARDAHCQDPGVLPVFAPEPMQDRNGGAAPACAKVVG